MKKIIFSIFIFCITFLYAQVPQGISYQAVAFHSGGNPVVNSSVGIKISILDNSTSGSVIYSETHTKTTNAQGLFNLNIGEGNSSIGNFTSINWGINTKFLKVEIDPNGGTSYSILGTNQLMSVPYALYAENTNLTSNNSSGLGTNIFKDSSFIIIDNDANSVRAFSNGVWTSQNISSFISGSQVISSNGNFIIIDNDANSVRAYSNEVWTSQSINSFISSTQVISSNGNFVVIDNDANSVRVYSNGVWTSQNINSFISSAQVIGSNGNFIVIDNNANSVRAFSNGVWISENISSFISGSQVIGSNGNFIVIDNDANNVKAFSNGLWVLQNINSFINSSSVIFSNID